MNTTPASTLHALGLDSWHGFQILEENSITYTPNYDQALTNLFRGTITFLPSVNASKLRPSAVLVLSTLDIQTDSDKRYLYGLAACKTIYSKSLPQIKLDLDAKIISMAKKLQPLIEAIDDFIVTNINFIYLPISETHSLLRARTQAIKTIGQLIITPEIEQAYPRKDILEQYVYQNLGLYALAYIHEYPF